MKINNIWSSFAIGTKANTLRISYCSTIRPCIILNRYNEIFFLKKVITIEMCLTDPIKKIAKLRAFSIMSRSCYKFMKLRELWKLRIFQIFIWKYFLTFSAEKLTLYTLFFPRCQHHIQSNPSLWANIISRNLFFLSKEQSIIWQ